MSSLRERLEGGEVFVTDGATGSRLFAEVRKAGVRYADELVLKNPIAVSELEKGYIDSGTTLLLTCTFNGNMAKMGPCGYSQEKVIGLNQEAVRIARGLAGERLVAGDIGPTGLFPKLYEPESGVTPQTLKNAFTPQVIGLTRNTDGENGIDLILLETFDDLTELGIAVDIVKRLAPHMPIAASMNFSRLKSSDRSLHTLMGVGAKELADFVIAKNLCVQGANCGYGPEGFVNLLKKIGTGNPDASLWGKPNVGRPTADFAVNLSDEEIRTVTQQLLDAGAQCVGWCCGSNQRYIEITASVVAQRT